MNNEANEKVQDEKINGIEWRVYEHSVLMTDVSKGSRKSLEAFRVQINEEEN